MCGSLIFALFALFVPTSGVFTTAADGVSVCNVGIGSDVMGFNVEGGVVGVVVELAIVGHFI